MLTASVNGAILNSKKLADQIGVSSKTVLSFFQILEDTHLGIALDAFHTSVRRQVRQAPKWYLFDVGVARALARMLKVDPLWGTSYGGSLFEQFLVVEWFKRAQYERNDYRFSYLQTKSRLEIDLVIERPGKPLAFIEIKSIDTVTERDFSTLRRLLPDFPEAEGFLVSRDRIEQVSNRIRALPWERALEEI
jgi:predicted AAA+ superfamily ATPase